MPDMDTDAHTPKGATHNHQETMDGLAAMPSPGPQRQMVTMHPHATNQPQEGVTGPDSHRRARRGGRGWRGPGLTTHMTKPVRMVAQMQNAQTQQATEMAAARAKQQTWRQGKQKPEDTPAEADKEDDNDRKQNGCDNDTPGSEHAGSTQNSQPQPIAHIDRTQGCMTKMATHQERGGTHPPEAANQASQRAKDPANPMRVQDILDKISIGLDLTGAQWARVMDLV